MVFYDTLDQRAWLTNGLHALLHLVRASVKYDRDNNLAEECLFDPSKLREDADLSSPAAAARFLRDRHNLDQPIFPNLDELRTEEATSGGCANKTEYRTSSSTLLKDRIIQIIFILEQLIDNQSNPEPTPGVPLKVVPRAKLEGYRFMDIATRRHPTARVVPLDVFDGAGKSWIDFTRTIKAVTLFGERFGELIAPINDGAHNLCSRWKTLPKTRDYLAVAAHDLTRIIHQQGSTTSDIVKVAPGVFWRMPGSAYEQCSCDRKDKPAPESFSMPICFRRPCDRVQVLLPQSMFRDTLHGARSQKCRRPILSTEGAVVFGRSEIFPWRWPDQGDPHQIDVQRSAIGTDLVPDKTLDESIPSVSITSPQSSESMATPSVSLITTVSSNSQLQEACGEVSISTSLFSQGGRGAGQSVLLVDKIQKSWRLRRLWAKIFKNS
jgi:hypothetical protein